MNHNFGEWRPIETAPKDGTTVLLIISRRCVVGRYAKVTNFDHDVLIREWEGWVDGRFEIIGLQPTYWLPIPPMPQ